MTSVLEQKINSLSEESLEKLTDYVDFLVYDAKKKADIKEFNEMCEKAQNWAKEVGFTEDKLNDFIKDMRRKNRKKANPGILVEPEKQVVSA